MRVDIYELFQWNSKKKIYVNFNNRYLGFYIKEVAIKKTANFVQK